MSSDSQDDPSFTALSDRTRCRIDNAFDSVASLSATRSASETAGGGFIVPESSAGPSRVAEYEAGGFIIEDIPSDSYILASAQSFIHLSEVPRALGLLGLIPDDDIMGVFKNAAAGWGAQDSGGEGVSRKDWRAVCAALLEGEASDGAGEESAAADEDIEMDEENGPDSDEFQIEESLSDVEESSDDEYEERSPTTAKIKKSQKTARTTTSKGVSVQLTAQQKAQCREDFGRFFPNVPDHELDRQRIMIKDITRVADLLKEQLKAEQIVEMLGTFSTSADRSMSLADFERMMITTRLVR